jgi:hypothetical protein
MAVREWGSKFETLEEILIMTRRRQKILPGICPHFPSILLGLLNMTKMVPGRGEYILNSRFLILHPSHTQAFRFLF